MVRIVPEGCGVLQEIVSRKVHSVNIKREKFLNILIYTSVFWIFAHGYRFMNNLYTSDALVEVFQDDIYWQRSLGRFMQPVVMIFRGSICAPWLIGCISVVLFSLAIYVVAELAEIDNRLILSILSGALVCNMTLTSATAAFLPWVDVYALALLLAVLGVWFFFKDKLLCYPAGCICLIVSMGLYQAYVDVALVMIMIVLIGKMIKGMDTKAFFTNVSKLFGSLVVSAVGYWCVFKAVLFIHKVEAATTYNGLSGVGDYTNVSFLELLSDTYGKFFSYLFDRGSFSSTIILNTRISAVWDKMIIVCVFLCMIVTFVGLILLNKRRKTTWLSRILQIVAILLFPLAANFVNVFSKGMEHALMVYAVFFFYVLFLYVFNQLISQKEKAGMLQTVCLLPIALIVWNNIVFSNQVYFKVDMMDRAALSYATRVVDRIETVEGYEAGVTPVVFIGQPEKSIYIGEVDYLRDVHVYGIDGSKTPFSYGSSFASYIRNYLNSGILVIEKSIPEEITNSMKDFPAEDSVAFYEDVLVVKLSNR